MLTKADEGGRGGNRVTVTQMLTEGGRGGVQEPLILADVICEQPLIVKNWFISDQKPVQMV